MTENKIRKNYDKLSPIYRFLGLDLVGDVGAMHELSKIEKKLHKHAEDACNFESTERQEKMRERYAGEMIELIEDWMPKLKGLVVVNGDPRGWALKIDPYKNDPNGCKADPEIAQLIRDARICRDWGGYGILCPSAQLE